jgi:hypothetical protein
VISRSRAGNVKKMALSIVDLLQICVFADRLDPLLQGHDFVVAGHHGHCAKFQSFRQVHGANRDIAAGAFDVFVEGLDGRFILSDHIADVN